MSTVRLKQEHHWNGRDQPSPPGTNVKTEMDGRSDGLYSFANSIVQTERGSSSESAHNYSNNIDIKKREIETEEEEEEKYFCGVCDHTSFSLEAYQEHVVSEQHVNRAARVFHFDVPTKKQLREEGKDKEIHHCEICDVNCNGDICWTAHLQGAKHKKNKKQKALEDEIARAARDRGVPQNVGSIDSSNLLPATLQDFLNHAEPLIGLEYITEIQIQGEVPHFHCELCDVKFDNNLKFPHLVGAKHRYQVVKKRDYDWAKNIQASCERRSELTVRLASVAKRLEEDEGRQISLIKVKQGTVFDMRDVKVEEEGLIQEPDLDDHHLDVSRESHLLPVAANPLQSENKIPSLMALGDGILPIPSGVTPIEVPKPIDDEGSPLRERSRKRQSDRSRSSTNRRDRSRHRSKDRCDSRDRRRDRSSDRMRGRSPERRPRRGRSPSRTSPHRSPDDDDDDGPKDISDEIREEMKRQERRKEERRRAEDRKRRHAEREENERKETEERRKRRRDGSARSDSRISSPPPEAPKVLDDDTKRLVMQNLTELAKCCVTNEADAELALQVSNALTQALLQYRMKTMPASVLQTLNAVGQQQQQMQQLQSPMQQPMAQQAFQQQQQSQQQTNFNPNQMQQPHHGPLQQQQPPPLQQQPKSLLQQSVQMNLPFRGGPTPLMARDNHLMPSPSGGNQMMPISDSSAGYFSNVQTPPGIAQSFQMSNQTQNMTGPQNSYPDANQMMSNQELRQPQSSYQQYSQQQQQSTGNPQQQQQFQSLLDQQFQQQQPLQRQLSQSQQQQPQQYSELQQPQQYAHQPQQISQTQNEYQQFTSRYDDSPSIMSKQSCVQPLMSSTQPQSQQRMQPLPSPNQSRSQAVLGSGQLVVQPLMSVDSKEQLHGLMEQSFAQPLRQSMNQMRQSQLPQQQFDRQPPQQSMMQQQQQFQRQQQQQQQQKRQPLLQQLHTRRTIKQEYDDSDDDSIMLQRQSQAMYERSQMSMR